MSGALSKRQQARNERTLQELIKTVPGNNVCADCQARNPGWASWSLGIFLCMRCAALHRKLGTHITKVKSLSMDSWSSEQVENMKRVGNVASNREYNPQNTKPPVPFDADEADSAMERFIRQKYMDRNARGGAAAHLPVRHNTGSTNSDDQPPPLPPKTGSRFGFRSASSIFPLSSKASRARRDAEVTAQIDAVDEHERDQTLSPYGRNKPSRVFGTPVGSEVPVDLESKMAKLRDMGFRDESRNLAVLKGLDGNLEKSIETLVRLGESGSSGGLTVGARSGENSEPSSRSRTPLSASTGLTIDRTPQKLPQRTSSNPFDMLNEPAAQPQSSQSTGALRLQSQQQTNDQSPYQGTTNPFGIMPSQSQYSLNQSFQNMSVSASQPLFPNHTGGFPGPQQPQHNMLYQQSMTPPVPSLPQQYYPPVIYENPAQQPPQQNTNYNPFTQQQAPTVITDFHSNQYTSQQHQVASQQVPLINTNFQSNPYASQQQQQAAPPHFFRSPLENSPQQQQYTPTVYNNGAQPLQQQQQQNPFFNQNSQQPQIPQQSHGYQQLQQVQQQPQYGQDQLNPQPMLGQQAGRVDKRSILDLYNYPQLAPSPLQHQNQNQTQNHPAAALAPSPEQQRIVSSPLATQMAGNRNPFMSSGGRVVQNQGGGPLQNMGPFGNGTRHVSQESMSIDSGGWQNGRHSPDAFAGLSARSMT